MCISGSGPFAPSHDCVVFADFLHLLESEPESLAVVNRVSHFVFMSGNHQFGIEAVHQVVHPVGPAVHDQCVRSGNVVLDVDNPFHVFLVVLVAHMGNGLFLGSGNYVDVVHQVVLVAGEYLYADVSVVA